MDFIYYTYILYHPEDKKFYIGSRKTKGDPKDDNYMGSCRLPNWKIISNKCKKRILKVFTHVQDCIEHESYLHYLHDVDKNDRYYNQSKQSKNKFYYDRTRN